MNLRQSLNRSWSARRVFLATLSAAAVIAGFWLIYRYRLVILIFFTAIVLATALKPITSWLVGRGLSRSACVVVVYFILSCMLVAILWLIAPIVIEQSLRLAASLPQMYQDLRTTIIKSPVLFLSNLALYLPFELRLLISNGAFNAESMDMVPGLITFFITFLQLFLVGVAVFLLTTFWILEGDRAVRSLLLYLPPRNRHEVQKLFEDVEEKLGAFVRGQIFLCLAIAVLALIAYLVIGLPNALVLSLIAGLLEAVPIFGPALGAIPAILVAFAYEPTMIIWVIAATALIQLLENYLLVPRVMGSTVGVNPILTLLVLTTLSTLLGLPGALLAIPSAAIIQLVLNRYVLSSDQSHWPLPVGRDRTSALRYEVQDLIGDVRKQLRRKDDRSNEESDQIEDSIESVALELDIYLKEEIGEEPAL